MEQNKNKIQAIIFDLDGTLLNTLEDLKDAVNAALVQFHMPIRTLEEVRNFVGNGIRNLMIRAVSNGEEHPLFEEIFTFFQNYYKEHCKEKTVPYDGIQEVMAKLKEHGIKMAIVSNKFDLAVKELNQQYFADFQIPIRCSGKRS